MSGPAWSPVEPVTPEVTGICFKVKSTIEERTGTYFKVYTPLVFIFRSLDIGTEYVVKIRVGDDECVHAVISAVFSSDGVKLTVLRVQYPKTLDDPLVPF